jgi:serine/threonine protein phosphatase PrpC
VTGVVLQAGGATDVGRLRTINQDSFVLLPDRDLFIVADGMGGHQGGEVASRLAIETLQVAYQDASAESLTEAIAVANHRIRNEGDADPDLRGMGTTVVALAVLPAEPDDADDPDASSGDEPASATRLVVANVGDSRGYLYRDDSLIQLTEDHSVVADLVREGRITAEEAEVHPQRNIVTRVLGVYETVEVDLWPVDPVQNDRFLLCSDGLFNEVGADQIGSVLRRLADPKEAADERVRLANEGGGRDNITAVVIDVLDDGGVAASASAALAGAVSGLESGPAPASGEDDPAGFTTALPPVEADELPAPEAEPTDAPRLSRKERRAAAGPRTRVTWRVLAFVVLVLAVIGGAIATIQWYGTSTYFVAFADDEIVIYQGRPEGILWIEPELRERTGIDRGDVPERFLPRIDAGNEQPTQAKAQQLVANIEDDIADGGGTVSTTTTSTTSTTSATSTTASSTTTQAN